MAKNDHNAYLTTLQTNKNPYVNTVGNAAKGVVKGVATGVAALNTTRRSLRSLPHRLRCIRRTTKMPDAATHS